MLKITDSAAALGVVTMLQFLPIMLLVLVAGVIADRVRKRDFLILTQIRGHDPGADPGLPRLHRLRCSSGTSTSSR